MTSNGKVFISITAVLFLAGFSFSACTTVQTKKSEQTVEKQTEIAPGNWDAFNRDCINSLIADYGKGSKNYNPEKPPYAVFDWDNTCIFLDVEEATLACQLENLRFAATPEELDGAIRMNIDPSTNFALKGMSGQTVTIDMIAQDICDSYTWLYKNYQGLGGGGTASLEEVKKNPNYLNFITKVRFTYDAISETFSEDIAYPWVLYLFTGMNEQEVRALTADTIRWQLTQPVSTVTWTSPDAAELPGQKAGQIQVTWKTGLRFLPEMQNLHAALRTAGFDVYICSASFIDVVKEIGTNPDFGYNEDESHIFGMQLERDSSGRIKTAMRAGYAQTQGPGKTETIKRFLAGPEGKYGYDPLLVGGDSTGDQNMLSDFPGMKTGLIINRLKGKGQILGKLSEEAVSSYGTKDARYLLQGRNDNTGSFTPDQMHIKAGKTTGVKLP
jgi:phosphoserine phosphatase